MANNFTISTALTTNNKSIDPGPYIVPPQLYFSTPPYAPFTIYIPAVAGANAGPNTGVTPQNANTDFTLVWSTTGAAAIAQVTVAPANLFTPANAGLFFASFNYFQQQLAALPAGTLAPNGVAVLANRVATSLPLNYTQILPLTYGLVPDKRYVDLAPGMNLVVDYGSYQYLSAPTVAIGALNAYAGVGTTRYRLRRRVDGAIGFNAFTDALRSWSITFNTPNQIAGLCDLEAAGANANFVRLVYPAQMQPAYKFSNTQPAANLNPVLLFASSLANMELATTNFLKNFSPGAAGQMAFFSGRAAIYPEIVISLNGVLTPVPLGTTVADLVGTTLSISPFDAWNSSGPLLQVARWTQGQAFTSSPGPSTLIPFTFNATTSVSATTNLTQWDLPVIAGDDVHWVISTGQ